MRKTLTLIVALLTLGLNGPQAQAQASSEGARLSRDGPAVEPQSELAVGDKIKPFTLPLLGGGQVTWPDDLQGQVLVVNYWATWCAPCVDEVPALERLRRQLKGSNVTILTVNIDEVGQMTEVTSLLERSRASFITTLDPGGQFALTWGTAKLPETYVISPDGIVTEKIIGAQVWDRGDRVRAYKALAAEHGS